MRRAWIEIVAPMTTRNLYGVALREEGVDRNDQEKNSLALCQRSPSVRRAWIEILSSFHDGGGSDVALREEGVDRNSKTHTQAAGRYRRPP